jgi:hypothetical protein
MSYNPYSPYSHVTYYDNNEDGAYSLSDGAYHSNSGNHNYLGNNYGYNPPSPEPHKGYDKALVTQAAEYGLTPQRLFELSNDCIREQNEWPTTDQEGDETRHEQRVRRTRDEREVEETEDTGKRECGEYSGHEHNTELVTRATELGLTPQRLLKLKEECI